MAIDANVAIYHYNGQSQQCSLFLERCARLDLHGFMPAHIGLEVLHQLMLGEARAAGLVSGRNPTGQLSDRVSSVQSLKSCYRDFDMLSRIGITLLETSGKAVERTAWFCAKFGLLANDAALLAVMEEHGLDALASADSKLQDIAPFKTYGVSDLR